MVPHETAAVLARSVYTIQPCIMSLHCNYDMQFSHSFRATFTLYCTMKVKGRFLFDHRHSRTGYLSLKLGLLPGQLVVERSHPCSVLSKWTRPTARSSVRAVDLYIQVHGACAYARQARVLPFLSLQQRTESCDQLRDVTSVCLTKKLRK